MNGQKVSLYGAGWGGVGCGGGVIPDATPLIQDKKQTHPHISSQRSAWADVQSMDREINLSQSHTHKKRLIYPLYCVFMGFRPKSIISSGRLEMSAIKGDNRIQAQSHHKLPIRCQWKVATFLGNFTSPGW